MCATSWCDLDLTFDLAYLMLFYVSMRISDTVFLLRKIALPYPHKCLLGFVDQNASTDNNFLRKYSCHER